MVKYSLSDFQVFLLMIYFMQIAEDTKFAKGGDVLVQIFANMQVHHHFFCPRRGFLFKLVYIYLKVRE